MTLPGQNRVQAPRPQPSTPKPPRHPNRQRDQHHQSEAVPSLPHHPFSKNLRWTAVTLVRSLTSTNPPERPCSQVADHVARAALRDMRHRFPNKDLLAVERNARRRVYDAVKVMAAVGAIQKARKTLKWLGVQHLVADASQLSRLIAVKRAVIAQKRRRLASVSQTVSHFRRFLSKPRASSRNRTSRHLQHGARFTFPFVLVKGHSPHVTTSSDRTRLSVCFDTAFSLFSEADVVSMLHAATPPTPSAVHCAASTAVTHDHFPTGASPLPPDSASHALSPAPRTPPPQPHRLIMMRHREHEQVQPALIDRSHQPNRPASPISSSSSPRPAHCEPNSAQQSATSRRCDVVQRQLAHMDCVQHPNRAPSPASPPPAAHCHSLGGANRTLSRRNGSMARCRDQNQLQSIPIHRSHCSNGAALNASSRRRPHCEPNGAHLPFNDGTAHRRKLSKHASTVESCRRRVVAPHHAVVLKLRVRAPQPVQFFSAQATMADDHSKLSTHKPTAEKQNDPAAAGDSTDGDEHNRIDQIAEEEPNPGAVEDAKEDEDRQPNVVARAAEDERRAAAATEEQTQKRICQPRVPIDRQAIWSDVVEQVARRPSSSSETERDLVKMMNRGRAADGQQEGAQQQGVDLLCYEDPDDLPEDENAGRVHDREVVPLPQFIPPPPRLELLNEAPELEEQPQEDEGPDAVPFTAEEEADNDLLDMDMDSEPCLSEEES